MRQARGDAGGGSERFFIKKGPSEDNGVEFGSDRLQQLRVQEVLTQAEGAPVTSAHAAQTGVAEERQTPTYTRELMIPPPRHGETESTI